MWEEQEEWGDQWAGPNAVRSEPDHLVSKWIKDQNPNYQSQLDMEVKWEAEAAEREQILRDYHWSKEEFAGGIVSNLLRALFIPKKIRNAVRRLEQSLWQRMLMIAPDIIWGILFAVIVSAMVMRGPFVSWEEETTVRTVQAITCSVTMYWATCNVLVRVINDWRFRRRLHWWAAQGYTEAEFSLGSLYEAGDGIPANPKMAAHWFHKAARHGHCEAQYMLGECYFRGYGVPVNLREARKWFQRAANQGDADAETMEEYIKKMLEASGDSGSASKNDPDHLPSRRVGKLGKNPPDELDETRKQRKEEQRKEYERMEALRKQKEQEKRKAKADKLKRERQIREEEEAAAARQAAQIQALVAEEQRQRQYASGTLPVKGKGAKAGDGSGKNGRTAGSKYAQPPPKPQEVKQTPSTAEAAAELVAQQERLSSRAHQQPPRSASNKAGPSGSGPASSRRSEDSSRHHQASGSKAGKENRGNAAGGSHTGISPSSSSSSLSSHQGPATSGMGAHPSGTAPITDRSPRVRGAQGPGHDLQRSTSTPSNHAGSAGASAGGRGKKDSSRQNSWPPKKTTDFKTRSREEQVAALTVPPPPPPPRKTKNSPTSSPEQPQLQPQPQPQTKDEPRGAPRAGVSGAGPGDASQGTSSLASSTPLPQHRISPQPNVADMIQLDEPRVLADDFALDHQQLDTSHASNNSLWSPEKIGGDLWGQGLGWTPLGGNGLSLGNGLGSLGNPGGSGDPAADASALDPLENIPFHSLGGSSDAQYHNDSLQDLAAHYMQRGNVPMMVSADPLSVGPNVSGNPMGPPGFDVGFGGTNPVDSHMWAPFGGSLGIPSTQPSRPAIIDDEEDNVCPVCLDRKPGGARLIPCGHTPLCLPCAKGLRSSHASCPYCLTPINAVEELYQNGD